MTPNHRRVLGIDPGIARLGWAVVDSAHAKSSLVAAGCLTTSPKQAAADRLLALDLEIKKMIRQYHPQQLAIEQVFFSKNVSTALLTGQVRGVVLTAAAEAKLDIAEYTPTAVKLAVTGDGRADKKQIRQMVKMLLGLKTVPKLDDTTDAIAIAMCGAETRHYS